MSEPDDLLGEVGPGEEYPIFGGNAPARFHTVNAGWACAVCGSVIPTRRSFAQLHLEYHAKTDGAD